MTNRQGRRRRHKRHKRRTRARCAESLRLIPSGTYYIIGESPWGPAGTAIDLVCNDPLRQHHAAKYAVAVRP